MATAVNYCMLCWPAPPPGLTLAQFIVTEGNRAALELYRRCGFVEFGLEPYAVALGDGYVAKVHEKYAGGGSRKQPFDPAMMAKVLE